MPKKKITNEEDINSISDFENPEILIETEESITVAFSDDLDESSTELEDDDLDDDLFLNPTKKKIKRNNNSDENNSDDNDTDETTDEEDSEDFDSYFFQEE